VLNRDGGTLRTMDLDAFAAEATAIFARHGHQLDCRIVAGSEIVAALEAAAATPGIDALLAGGGDGTISSAAGIAFRSGVALAVLPAGTMNLFARALKLPMDPRQALEALASGQAGTVDVATANGRVFVHQFGVGIHARLVRIRETMTYRSRIGKMLASLRAVGAAVINPPNFEAELHTAAGTEKRRVSGIAISNNPLGSGSLPVPHAERLDTGRLGVYVVAPMGTGSLIRLAFALFLGTWRESPMVSESEAGEVTLRFPHRKRSARAVIDGELIRLENEIALRIHPGALKVIEPRRASES